MLTLNQGGIYEGVIAAGIRLSETPDEEGGWKSYFEGDGMSIADDYTRASTALMLENAKRWVAQKCRRSLDAKGRLVIDEATRSALVGGFSDYLFPIIRAGFPNNPINDLVSVQPTTRRTATIVNWHWVAGTTKGSVTQGQRLFDANVGKQDNYTDFAGETITGEVITTAGTGVMTGTLAWHDGGGVRPGTVALTVPMNLPSAFTVVIQDDGNGGFITPSGLTAFDAATINYSTGAFSIDFGSTDAVTSTQQITANYGWDSEGGTLPQMDIQITTSTVDTIRDALKINYSVEAMQDVMAEFGVSLEPNLISGCAEQMNFQIARKLIRNMWNSAGGTDSFTIGTIGSGGLTGVTFLDRIKDLIYTLNSASNTIWSQTQKAYGNWLICDENAASLIESLPSTIFQPAPPPTNLMGLVFIGTLLGKFRVYKDIHLDKEAGATGTAGNILMGYKGTQFWDAGMVWSPYQLFYTTQPLTTSDFMVQKGIATRYALKMVNNLFYRRITIN